MGWKQGLCAMGLLIGILGFSAMLGQTGELWLKLLLVVTIGVSGLIPIAMWGIAAQE